MLVQSLKFIQQHQGNIHNISIYGQEKNPTIWKLDVAEINRDVAQILQQAIQDDELIQVGKINHGRALSIIR